MKRTSWFAATLLLAIFSGPTSRVTWAVVPGAGDPDFRPGSGADRTVRAVVIQSDRKILIGGYFDSVDDVPRHGVARLLPNGSIDPQFVPPTGAGSQINSMAPHANGKVTIGGWFTLNNGATWQGVARLKADGSVDETFVMNGGPDDTVFAVAVQCDDAVVIGGMFTRVGATPRNRVARLGSDGTLDPNFNPNANERVFSISIASQSDSRIIVGGYFTRIGNSDHAYIARLNPDGTTDETFARGGAGSGVLATAVQTDGSVVIAGSFLRVGSETRSGVARFRPDGSLDPGFNPGEGPDRTVRAVALQVDGKIVIGGDFTEFSGVARSGVARLKMDGSVDQSFDPGTGSAEASVWSVALQPDGAVVAGGAFTSLGNLSRSRIARLYGDGSHGVLDATFSRCAGPENTVLAVAAQPDDKLLIGGFFSSVDGVSRSNIARLNADGTLDRSFDPGTGTSGLVASIAVQRDGNIIIGGGFDSFNNIAVGRVARLTPNGALDPTFRTSLGAGTNAPPIVRAVAVARNGKVVIGGDFTTVNGIARNRIARLLPTGKLDLTFNPGRGADNAVLAIGLEEQAFTGVIPLPDAKILIAGAFRVVNGVRRDQVARLNGNGQLDSTFRPAQGFGGVQSAMARQPDGKVIIAGVFASVNGMPRARVARLNPNGGLDPDFVPDGGALRRPLALAVQADGMTLVGGGVQAAGQNTSLDTWIVRLRQDGSTDTSFGLNATGLGLVSSIALQSDGRIVMGGYFRLMGPFSWKYVARVSP